MSYLPDIAWSTRVEDVELSSTPYHFYCTVNPLDPNDPGFGELEIGYMLLDFNGYPFEVVGFGDEDDDDDEYRIEVYDINERGDGTNSAYAPYPDRQAYIYEPKNSGVILSQAQLRKLDRSAPDILYPIEKGIIWKYRGIEIDALYGNGEVEETITEGSVDNITKLSLSPEFILRTEEDGWQGGKKYSLSLNGLLHNSLPDIQGTGSDGDYIHLDQDQVDALWTKVGNDIRRDSRVGIGKAPDTTFDVEGVGQFGEDGARIQIGFDIGAGGGVGIYEYGGYDIAMKYSDYLGYGQWSGVTDSGLFIKNGNVGVKTHDPQDSFHTVGYVRVSTLAETANSSIVTSNADGRLIKLPYDNDESKYLRSDGTWAPILTSLSFLDLGDTPSTYTANKWLKVNAGGTALEFTDAPSGGTVAGADTQVQFNDGGAFGADSDFTYNKTTNALTITGNYSGGNLETNVTSLSTRLGIGSGNSETETAPRYNTFVGYRSGYSLTTGSVNTLLGYEAGYDIVDGEGNTCIGYQAGKAVTSSLNTFVGWLAGTECSTGGLNLFLGVSAGRYMNGNNNIILGSAAGSMTSGDYNVLIGPLAANNQTSGGNNVYLGRSAGSNNVTGSNNIFLGATAGYYETGSNKLFIDNRLRTNEATARTNSLIYGEFNATVANQYLRVNGQFQIKDGITAPSTVSGYAQIYVDAADGDLKIKFGDGTVKTIVTDT